MYGSNLHYNKLFKLKEQSLTKLKKLKKDSNIKSFLLWHNVPSLYCCDTRRRNAGEKSEHVDSSSEFSWTSTPTSVHQKQIWSNPCPASANFLIGSLKKSCQLFYSKAKTRSKKSAESIIMHIYKNSSWCCYY